MEGRSAEILVTYLLIGIAVIVSLALAAVSVQSRHRPGALA